MYALLFAASMMSALDMEPAYIKVTITATKEFQAILTCNGRTIEPGAIVPVSLLHPGQTERIRVKMTYVDNDGEDKTVEFLMEVQGGYVHPLPIKAHNWRPFSTQT